MKVISPEDQERIAIHEAGHAVMANLRGMKVKLIVVDFENEAMRGYVCWEKPDLCFKDGRKKSDATVRRILYSELLINLAGIKAMQAVTGWANSRGFAHDWECSKALAASLVTGKDDKADYYLDRAGTAAKRMLMSHVDVLQTIARRLLENSTITSEEFLEIMKGSNK